MIKTIQIKRWAILVENIDYNNYFIEDKLFEKIEEAAEYLKNITEKSITFKGIAIQPVWTTVNVETRDNAVFIEDNTIIFQKEK